MEKRGPAVREYVVDASIFGPLFFEDETDEIFGGLGVLLAEGACTAPQHWQLELANQILFGFRRKRLTGAMADMAVGLIATFDVAIDDSGNDAIDRVFSLAKLHGLTVYDAAYLELAMRRNASLASYDTPLRKAAKREGLEVLPR